jgi:hypothetical protein
MDYFWHFLLELSRATSFSYDTLLPNLCSLVDGRRRELYFFDQETIDIDEIIWLQVNKISRATRGSILTVLGWTIPYPGPETVLGSWQDVGQVASTWLEPSDNLVTSYIQSISILLCCWWLMVAGSEHLSIVEIACGPQLPRTCGSYYFRVSYVHPRSTVLSKYHDSGLVFIHLP